MNENNKGAPPPAIKPGDILHAIFRQKWKIIIISGLGIVATCLLPLFVPRLYQSEAKILIKYVLEGKSARQIAVSDSQVKAVNSQGESIINTELQVLSSLDLAREVARAVGPDKVLAKAGGGTNIEAAAALIRGNLLTDVPKESSVIRILFQHPDREMVQPILKQVIDSYLKMHLAIHLQGGELDDFLTQETDQLHSRLTTTEDALRQAKAKAGIISLDDSKKSYTDQISKIQAAILDAEAELAERQTSAAEIAKLLHTKPLSTTNEAVVANNVAVAADKEAEYKGICRLLDSLHRKQDEMLTYLTPESGGVKDVQAQIAANEKRKQQMEEKNPGLLAAKAFEATPGAPDLTAGPRAELISETAKVIALQSKIKVLTQQLDNIHKEATNLNVAESSITELQRKLGLDEARYKYYFDNLEQARIDERLGAGRVSNISTIQEASPPFLAASKLLKMMGLALFGSIGAAFALAFAFEFYLDPSLKRPGEVEAKLGVPLFISIPLMHRNGKAHALAPGRAVPLLSEKGNGISGESTPASHDPPGAEAPSAPAPASTLDSAVSFGTSVRTPWGLSRTLYATGLSTSSRPGT